MYCTKLIEVGTNTPAPDRLVAAYSAPDVFAAPSIQENLPTIVLEAMAYGIPCVAFDIVGMPDMIEHKKTGYLARPYEPEDLAERILRVLADQERKGRLGRSSRQKIDEGFSVESIAARYALCKERYYQNE